MWPALDAPHVRFVIKIKYFVDKKCFNSKNTVILER